MRCSLAYFRSQTPVRQLAIVLAPVQTEKERQGLSPLLTIPSLTVQKYQHLSLWPMRLSTISFFSSKARAAHSHFLSTEGVATEWQTVLRTLRLSSRMLDCRHPRFLLRIHFLHPRRLLAASHCIPSAGARLVRSVILYSKTNDTRKGLSFVTIAQSPKCLHLLSSPLHSFPNLLSRVYLPANTHQNPPISILSLRKGLLQKGAIRTLHLRLSTRRGRQLRDVSGAKRVRWTR